MDVIPDDGAPRAREVLRGGCACDVAQAPAPTSPRVVAALVALAMLGARRRSKRPTAG